MEAIDCSTRLTSQTAAALRSAGYSAVGRYLGLNRGWSKSLTPDELKAIVAAGLSVFLIWEGNPTYPAYFTYQRGVSDAQAAMQEAQYLGITGGVALYFTVDYDARSGDFARIIDYFRGVKDAVKGNYLIGAYGSYKVLQALSQSPTAPDRYFQTYAWSSGQVFPGNHIYQYKNGVSVCGIEADKNRVSDLVGMWPVAQYKIQSIRINLEGDEDLVKNEVFRTDEHGDFAIVIEGEPVEIAGLTNGDFNNTGGHCGFDVVGSNGNVFHCKTTPSRPNQDIRVRFVVGRK